MASQPQQQQQEQKEDCDDEEGDEFFGNDSDEDRMAQQVGAEAERTLQNAAYLDAYDEQKETRLQEGFEAGYLEVYNASRRLGELLGRISARAKLAALVSPETSADAEATSRDVAGRYRVLLGEINQGNKDNAKERLLELERECKEIVEQKVGCELDTL